MDFTQVQRRAVLDLARSTIRAVLAPASCASPAECAGVDVDTDPTLLSPAGCFVSLHQLHTHRLRGCVGRLDATAPLVQAVRAAAESVLEDPRFYDNPVRFAELAELELEVSILSPLRPAQGPLAFDLFNEGIVLTCGRRTGCFLPQVARETGWGKEQLLERLCTEKMGLPAYAWRGAEARLSVFSTVTIGPEPFVWEGSISS